MTKSRSYAAATAFALTLAASGCNVGADEESAPGADTTVSIAPSSAPPSTRAPEELPLEAVQVGDCVDREDGVRSITSGVQTVTVLECGPDTATVLTADEFRTTFHVSSPGASSYPGYPNIALIAMDECRKMRSIPNPGNNYAYIYPTKQLWDAGNHTVLCLDPTESVSQRENSSS